MPCKPIILILLHLASVILFQHTLSYFFNLLCHILSTYSVILFQPTLSYSFNIPCLTLSTCSVVFIQPSLSYSFTLLSAMLFKPVPVILLQSPLLCYFNWSLTWHCNLLNVISFEPISAILFHPVLCHPASATPFQPAVCHTLTACCLLYSCNLLSAAWFENLFYFIFLTHKQILDAGRQRLFTVLQERSRVIDLLCHALNSISSAQGNHAKCRVPTSLDGRILDIDSNRFGTAVADALGPYTPEADQVNYTKSNDGVHLSLYTVL